MMTKKRRNTTVGISKIALSPRIFTKRHKIYMRVLKQKKTIQKKELDEKKRQDTKRCVIY